MASGDREAARAPLDTLILVIHNVAKKVNISTLCTSAVGFGAEVFLVGCPHFSPETHISKSIREADGALRLTRFSTLRDVKSCLDDRKIPLVGVEIVDGATDVEKYDFPGPMALIMGNEGTGLTDRQKELCDHFLYILQHGHGTASLNVAVAASIIMHRFHCRRLQQRSDNPKQR